MDNFGLYTVDTNYVKLLNEHDSEVFFDTSGYDRKPYAGIVFTNNGFNYFIPLTSAKPKHTKWANKSQDNCLIYEYLTENEFAEIKTTNGVFVYNEQQKRYKHIMAVLEIKKMIPVPQGYFSKINFAEIEDISYRILLNKEYDFLRPHRDELFFKAKKIYDIQMNTSVVRPFYCDFKKLEKLCIEYN